MKMGLDSQSLAAEDFIEGVVEPGLEKAFRDRIRVKMRKIASQYHAFRAESPQRMIP